jgi:hypothetical protein
MAKAGKSAVSSKGGKDKGVKITRGQKQNALQGFKKAPGGRKEG